MFHWVSASISEENKTLIQLDNMKTNPGLPNQSYR